MILFKNNTSPQTKLVVSFILIVLLHIIFKLVYLDYSCFWYDETFGLHYSLQDWGLIKHTSEWDLNAPLYYYFLWLWRHFFGISEYAIRFSSVLFSAFSAGMLYVFSYKFFNKTTALIALLIYTSSNEIFFYSHEARCYSILFFLTLSSSYFYFNLLEKKSVSSIILLGIINFLLVYTHYITGLILVFQVLLLLIFYNKAVFKRVSIAFGITFLLVCWRFTKKTILLILNHEKSPWMTKATFEDLKNTIYSLFNTQQIFFFYLILMAAILIIKFTNYQISHLSPALSEGKGVSSLREDGRWVRFLYLLLSSVGTILICFAIGTITPFFSKRYVVFAIPFICILIGFIVSSLNNRSQRYMATALICLISLYSFSKIDFRTPKHMNYRDAMVFIKQEKTPSTLILIQTRDMRDLFAYYYDISFFMDYYNTEIDLNKQHIYTISGADDLKTIDFTKYDKVILTQTFVKLDETNENFLKSIASHYKTRTLVKEYENIDIIIFSK
ncbi:MAG: glycosyltransferase family 39 protein [Bacteroidia bacterium]